MPRFPEFLYSGVTLVDFHSHLEKYQLTLRETLQKKSAHSLNNWAEILSSPVALDLQSFESKEKNMCRVFFLQMPCKLCKEFLHRWSQDSHNCISFRVRSGPITIKKAFNNSATYSWLFDFCPWYCFFFFLIYDSFIWLITRCQLIDRFPSFALIFGTTVKSNFLLGLFSRLDFLLFETGSR